jgi:hypothetical protein
MNNDFQGYWVFVDRFCRNYLDIFFVCCYEQSYWSLRICETYNLLTIPFNNLYPHLQIMLSILLRFESNFKKKYSIGFLKVIQISEIFSFDNSLMLLAAWRNSTSCRCEFQNQQLWGGFFTSSSNEKNLMFPKKPEK